MAILMRVPVLALSMLFASGIALAGVGWMIAAAQETTHATLKKRKAMKIRIDIQSTAAMATLDKRET